MKNGLRLVAAIGLCLTLAHFGPQPEAAAQPAALPAPAQELPGGEPVPVCKKQTFNACTSCAQNLQDIECKSGRDHEDCTTGHVPCTNGTLCDNHQPTGPC